jgi:hypothetical protein
MKLRTFIFSLKGSTLQLIFGISIILASVIPPWGHC